MFLFQGNVEVELGNENLVFQGGPFMYFGTQVLAGEQCRKMGKFLKAGNCFDSEKSTLIVLVVFASPKSLCYTIAYFRIVQNNPSFLALISWY